MDKVHLEMLLKRGTTMIKVEGLTKIYKTRRLDVTALSEVDLVLPSRGLVAIYGENGCGKTTLLNILATADTDYKGSVSYDGIDYRTVIPALRRNVISFVLQEEHFIPYLNLSENLALFGDEDAADATRQALARYELSEKAEVDPKNLSGGQKQRSSIIRGILKKSEVLLVDEPTSSLNEEMEAAVFAELKAYAKEKLVILVSHNIRLIRANADLIIHMDKGRIGSVESNAKNDLRYDGTTVSVPRNFFNLSALDPEFVKASLTKSGELTVKARSDEANEEREADYRPRDTRESWVSPKPIGGKRKRKLVLSSLLHIKGTLALGISIVSLFAILISFLFSFAYFNQSEFVFQSLSDNLDGFIRFEKDSTVSIDSDEGKQRLSLGKYLAYEKAYPSPKLLLVDSSIQLSLPYESQRDGIYKNFLYGTVFCDENDIELVCGEFCEADEILLTDYLADAFIACSSEYDMYAAILERGIFIQETHYKVSGIVDTDYEKYLDKYTDPSFEHSQSYIDYQNGMQNIYARMYRSLEAYLESDAIWYTPVQHGNRFCNTYSTEANRPLFEGVIDSFEEIASSDCYINEAMADEIGEASRVRTAAGYFYVKGVVSDGREEATLYVLDAKLTEMKMAPFSSVQSLLTIPASADEIAFLSEHDMMHGTSLSGYIRDVTNIISIASRIFLFLAILLSTFVLIAVTALVSRTLRGDRTAIALLKSGGHSTRSILSLEVWKLTILFALSSTASALLYLLASWLLNAALTGAFDMKIHLSILEAKTFLLTNAILIGAFAVSSTIALWRNSKRSIIKMLS